MNENCESYWTSRRLVIAGGSGFLGRECARYFLERGAEVVILSRTAPLGLPGHGKGSWRWVDWNAGPTAWREVLEGAGGLINFVGRSVDCRKTPANCDAILRSRVESVRRLAGALEKVEQKPPVWVQAGTAHIYGDPAEERIGDDGSPGWGLAPHVGQAWEKAFTDCLPAGMRGVVLRTSFVLGTRGGPLPVLARLARCGLGGTAGHGCQGFSWIHLDDFLAVIGRAMGDQEMTGTWNTTSPCPVSQKEFMACLRRVVGMPVGLPAPAFLIRLAARWVLNTDPDLVLQGRYVLPTKLQQMGFPFAFPKLEEALKNLLAKGR